MPKGSHRHRISPGDLLVVAPAQLDDACFSVPATRALAAYEMVHRLKVLCTEDQAAFWNTISVFKTISFPAQARPAAIADAVWDDGGKFSAALAWEPGKAAKALTSLGIRKNFGPAALGRDFISISTTRESGPIQHRVQDFLQVAKALGARPFHPAFFAPVDLGLETIAPSIALIPDSEYGPSSLWREASWAAVGGKLIERHGLRPTIVGPGPAATALAAELGDSATLEQPESLDERIKVMARHKFVIACDGISPHLASHVGATCVVLFGPTDPNWRRPLGTRHVPLHHHVECAPCLLPDCPLDHRCMHAIDSDQVLDAVGPLLDGAG